MFWRRTPHFAANLRRLIKRLHKNERIWLYQNPDGTWEVL